MRKILIAYATKSGSTAEVAQAVGEELAQKGGLVDVLPVEAVQNLESYSAVVLGAPMIMGWHRGARKFIKKHRGALRRIPVAYFFTALSLTRTADTEVDGIPVCLDRETAKPPRNPEKPTFHERYSTMGNYLRPVLKLAPSVKPVSVAFLGGKLEMLKLKLLPMLFVKLVIRAEAGDFRNWDFIHRWAAEMRQIFK